MTQLELIKQSSDNCKTYKYNGVEFWVNPYNVIMQSDDWNICDALIKAGLVTRKFYRWDYGHIEYKLNN